MRAESSLAADEAAEILFEEGIIGVPRARRFELLEREGSPIRVLRCLDLEGFALPVVDPRIADTKYQPVLGPRVQEALLLEAGEPILLLAVTTLEPAGPVANLRAPLVVNVKRRLAKQVILDDRAYPLRAPLQVAR
jgi:flagellar assembly factor FliW